MVVDILKVCNMPFVNTRVAGQKLQALTACTLFCSKQLHAVRAGILAQSNCTT